MPNEKGSKSTGEISSESSHILMKILVFTSLWIGFGAIWLSRKAFGIIKVDIGNHFQIEEELLSLLDIGFSLPYAIGSILGSSLGDQFPAHWVLTGGLVGTALSTLPMSYVTKYYQLVILIFLNGTFQSIAWPTSCKVISSYCSDSKTTTIIGAFSTSGVIGSIGGSLLAVYFQEEFGWRSVFWLPTIFLTFSGLLVLFITYLAQRIINGKSDEVKKQQDNEVLSGGLNPMKCLKIPNVLELSLALFCIKLVKSAGLFWLPLFLLKSLGYSNSEAGLMSISAEVGGVAGSIVIPLAIDKCASDWDIAASVATSIGSGVSFLLLLFSHEMDAIIHIVLLFTAGAFLCASEVVLGGSVPSRIGKKFEAESSINGFINGVASFGGVAEGIIIAFFLKGTGTDSIAYVMCIFSALAALISIRATLLDRKNLEST